MSTVYFHPRTRDGRLYLVEVRPLMSEPVLFEIWWATDLDPDMVLDAFAPWDRDRKTARVTLVNHRQIEVQVSEQPAFTVDVPVPQPRGRGPFRWEMGTWQRWRKTGWEDVPL